MAIKGLGTLGSIFKGSPDDDNVYVYEGRRRRSAAGTTQKSDEYVVAADGSGDYTDIASALTALGSSSGTIRVKAGNYSITSNISLGANQTILGSGYGTRIHTTSNITLITLSGNRSAIQMCRIDGNSTGSSQQGISVTGDECIIRDCWVTQMGGKGINCSGGGMILNGTRVQDTGSDCLALAGSGHMISGCEFENASTDGITLVSVTFTSITGCKITNHGNHGIDCSVSVLYTTITGNYCQSNGDTGTGSGIHFGSGCNECTVVGNVCNDNDDYGMLLDGGTAPNRITIVSNIMRNNTTGAISDGGTNTINANNQT